MYMRGKEDGMSVVVSEEDDEEEEEEEEEVESTVMGGGRGGNERIFVSVRLRPLNEREIAKNDASDWECIDNKTIIFKSSMLPPDRSSFPTASTFDRVFGSECSTEQVYWEGAKETALSVVSGIHATIFAYGQTSSGKTYTMIGITQHAVADIYEYIDKHKEREFVLKFSALEIYNEAVRDLLSMDNSPLRLLDDPERGTVVEKLIEETLIDLNHLQDLLSICEAQRQVGDTSLNETSSRSHQILRLTVESSSREHSGAGNFGTLTAAVNFVDLAGSERASQALSAAVRLKEGSHINRSLLTLGTVIRKLSKGRSGHVPYRDSKLTRILQNSLGGNARTAIICTMSPAHSHVDQSRNTLSFASCAKDVTTNAHVNLVMSDKALVRQLQKELARLESQLSSLESTSTVDSAALLREKDDLIEKMSKEIKELTCQRDLAQSRLESLLNLVGENQPLRDEHAASGSSKMMNLPLPGIGLRRSNNDKDLCTQEILEISGYHEDNSLLDDSTPKFSGPDPCHGWEEIAHIKNEDSVSIWKECIELEPPGVKGEAEDLLPVSEDKEEKSSVTRDMNEEVVPFIKKEDKALKHIDVNKTYNALRQRIQEFQETINQLEQSPSSEEVASNSKGLTWARSKSRRSVLMTIPSDLWSEKEEENESIPLPVSEKCFPESENVARKGSQDSRKSVSAGEEEEVIKEIDVDVEDTTSVLDFVAGVNKIAKLQGLEVATRSDESMRSTRDPEGENVVRQHPTDWPLRFERYRRKIIDLWTRCNVPLVHRSYFFLLFKGDHSDSVYMEVELRRLHFLKDAYSRGTNSVTDGQIISLATSLKALNRERQYLAKKIQKKYGRKDREDLYRKWGIKLDTKQRSLQLARRLWSDTKDMRHVKDSSVLVAKLVGFVEPRSAPKELFGLSFLNPSTSQRSPSWKDNMSALL